MIDDTLNVDNVNNINVENAVNVNKNESINIDESDEILYYRGSPKFRLTTQVGVECTLCTMSPTHGNYNVTNFDIDDSFLSPRFDTVRARSSMANVISMGGLSDDYKDDGKISSSMTNVSSNDN